MRPLNLSSPTTKPLHSSGRGFTLFDANPLRYRDPSGHAVDEYGDWTPCNLLPGRADSCSLLGLTRTEIARERVVLFK
jgi:hypothetical protein